MPYQSVIQDITKYIQYIHPVFNMQYTMHNIYNIQYNKMHVYIGFLCNWKKRNPGGEP